MHLRQLLTALALAALLAGCAAPAPAPSPAPSPAPTRPAEPTDPPSTPIAPPTAAPPTATAAPSATPAAPRGTPTATPPPSPSIGEPTATPAFPETRITAANIGQLAPLRTIGYGGATSAAVSPDGRLLAVGTTAGVALFELPGMRHLRFEPTIGAVEQIAFTDDGARLRIRTSEPVGTATIVDPAGIADVAPDTAPLPDAASDPRGELRVEMPVPDAEPTPGVSITRAADQAQVYADDTTARVAFSPGGALIALVDYDGTVRLIDRAGAPQGEVAVPRFSGVGFTPDAQQIVTAGRRVWLWDAVTGAAAGEAPGGIGDIVSPQTTGIAQRVLPTIDGKTLTVAGLYSRFEAASLAASSWSMGGGTIERGWSSAAGGIGITNFDTYVGAVSPASALTASTQDGKTVGIYDDATAVRTVEVAGTIRALAFSPDEKALAIGTRSGRLRLVWLAEDAPDDDLAAPGPVVQLEFSPDGALVAARSADGKIRVWRTQDATPVTTVAGEPLQTTGWAESWPAALAFTADGELLFAWGAEGVKIFQVRDGALLRQISGRVEQVSVGPRRRVVAILRRGQVELWGIPAVPPGA